jgi:cAMP-specific phosphodiesterase 4
MHHIFSFLFAAMIHDIGHPGTNNAFMINTHDKIAIRYNDKSVLESMHSAKAFQITAMPQFNIFYRMTPEEQRMCRGLIIE